MHVRLRLPQGLDSAVLKVHSYNHTPSIKTLAAHEEQEKLFQDENKKGI